MSVGFSFFPPPFRPHCFHLPLCWPLYKMAVVYYFHPPIFFDESHPKRTSFPTVPIGFKPFFRLGLVLTKNPTTPSPPSLPVTLTSLFPLHTLFTPLYGLPRPASSVMSGVGNIRPTRCDPLRVACKIG